MRAIIKFARSFAANESGATAIEYGLIASLVVLALLTGLEIFANGTLAMYAFIVATVSGAI